MVEFAFVSIPFIILVFGLMEFAYAIFCYNAVSNSAHEAARRAMVLNRIKPDGTNGNSYQSAGNTAGTTVSNPGCNATTIAGTVGCDEREFLVTGTFRVDICGPSATTSSPGAQNSTPTCGALIPLVDNGGNLVSIPPNNYVAVKVRYDYRPIISFPISNPVTYTMVGWAQVQTQ